MYEIAAEVPRDDDTAESKVAAALDVADTSQTLKCAAFNLPPFADLRSVHFPSSKTSRARVISGVVTFPSLGKQS